MPATSHWADEIGTSLFATYAHIPGEQDAADHAGPRGDCTEEQRELVGTVGGKLCSG